MPSATENTWLSSTINDFTLVMIYLSDGYCEMWSAQFGGSLSVLCYQAVLVCDAFLHDVLLKAWSEILWNTARLMTCFTSANSFFFFTAHSEIWLAISVRLKKKYWPIAHHTFSPKTGWFQSVILPSLLTTWPFWIILGCVCMNKVPSCFTLSLEVIWVSYIHSYVSNEYCVPSSLWMTGE